MGAISSPTATSRSSTRLPRHAAGTRQRSTGTRLARRGPSTAGPGGLDVVIVDGPGGDRSVAYCPADHPYVLGGGYQTYNYEVIASFPVGSEGSSGNGWEVQTVDFPNGSPASAYAICAK